MTRLADNKILTNDVADNELSVNLTEKWKNGQLEGFKWYYVKFKTGDIDICWLTEWSNDELRTGGQYFDGIEDEKVLEILAPVPSYDEWKNTTHALEADHEAIKMQDKTIDRLVDSGKQRSYENTKLKDLLKDLISESDCALQSIQKDCGRIL